MEQRDKRVCRYLNLLPATMFRLLYHRNTPIAIFPWWKRAHVTHKQFYFQSTKSLKLILIRYTKLSIVTLLKPPKTTINSSLQTQSEPLLVRTSYIVARKSVETLSSSQYVPVGTKLPLVLYSVLFFNSVHP